MKKVMYNDNQLSGSFGQENLPIGSIIAYGGVNPPIGFLLCNGANVSRTLYADLFNAIGTAYGEGDGSTTFTLPDLRSKFPQGANGDLGETKAAGLPNLEGSFSTSVYNGNGAVADGVFQKDGMVSVYMSNSQYSNYPSQKYKIDASKGGTDPVYGKSTTVQPPAQTCNYIIKYCKAISPSQESVIDDNSVSGNTTWSSTKIVQNSVWKELYYTSNYVTGNVTLNDSLANYNEVCFVCLRVSDKAYYSNYTIPISVFKQLQQRFSTYGFMASNYSNEYGYFKYVNDTTVSFFNGNDTGLVAVYAR